MARHLLRNPEFGNTWKLNNNTIFHRNMSGELRTQQVSGRPVFESFNVVIKALSLTQMQLFRDFVVATAGQVVSMKDFEGRSWVGIIINDTLNITKYKRAANCLYQTGFSFEGTIS